MDKEAARQRLRGTGPIPEEIAIHVTAALFGWLSERLPGTASAYLAMEGEVDVTGLFARLPGWRWVLPRVEADLGLTFRDRDVGREAHRWGMEQPVEQGPVIPVLEIDVFLVPGLAFDASGHRLGRGGGYYDRVLAARRGDSVALGITWSGGLVADLPVEGHDQAVDLIVTEDGLTPPTR
jgi:5-formyltetrahydrofolate cyclo-ligase